MQPDNTITTQQLQPIQPLTLPPQQVDTSAVDLIDKTAILQKQLADKQQKATTERTQGLSDIEKLMSDIGVVESKRGQYETQAGADTNMQAYNDLQSNIDLEQRRIKRFADQALENPNMTANVAARKVNEEQRKSASLLADLSISQNIAARNLDRARDIADRKIEMELAPLKQNLEAKKFIFEANKDVWNASEKALLENQIKQEERAYEKQITEKKDLENLRLNILTNQAPQSIKSAMELAKTRDELLKIPGVEKYLMSPAERLDLQLKGLQVQKLQDEISTINPDAGELVKIGGQDYIRYKDGTISDPILPGAKDLSLVSSRLTDKINTLENLTKPSVGIATSAGSLRGAPIPFLAKGKINDWRADVINTVQKLTVDELGRVKSDGVTFGALSNGERQAVGDAATALSAAMIYTGSGDDRRPTGKFKMSEKKVIEELQKIQDAYKLDFERRVGVQYDLYKKNPSILNDKIADDLVDSVAPLLQETNYGSYPIN